MTECGGVVVALVEAIEPVGGNAEARVDSLSLQLFGDHRRDRANEVEADDVHLQRLAGGIGPDPGGILLPPLADGKSSPLGGVKCVRVIALHEYLNSIEV